MNEYDGVVALVDSMPTTYANEKGSTDESGRDFTEGSGYAPVLP